MKMKKIAAVLLALAFLMGMFNVLTIVSSAEEPTENWVELGNNDSLTWMTCDSGLEDQTVEFAKPVKARKLRLYVTETFGGEYQVPEIEILDSKGNIKSSTGLWASAVTVTSNLSGINADQLGNLCNGNGGSTGFAADSGWDNFVGTASSTEYIEFDFDEDEYVEVAAVRIWANWANDPGWGHGPKKWNVIGDIEAVADDTEWVELGNNDYLDWETNSGDLEGQTVEFDKPVKVSKLRFYVTEGFGSGYYKIHEIEAFDKNGANKISPAPWAIPTATVTSNLTGINTDRLSYLCNGNGGTSGFSDGNGINWDFFDAGASGTQYIEFDFGEYVEIASVKVWSTWATQNAPKKWKVTGDAQPVVLEPEWRDLANNDLATWNTCDAAAEGQTIEFSKPTMVKTLRLYVTDLFGGEYHIREIEAFNKSGVNQTSAGLWNSRVTVTSTLKNINVNQLKNLCDGNGGSNGFDGSSYDWDDFTCATASSTDYIEIDFGKFVEISSVQLWSTWCNGGSWGNAPKKWKVAGLVQPEEEISVVEEADLVLLGDNSAASWSSAPSADFENQRIVFSTPVVVNKLRLKVTDTYPGGYYKISEFEAFDTNGVNVLASVTTDNISDANAGQQSLTSDGRVHTSLAKITFADGMNTNFASSMVNGENFNNDNHWYSRTVSSTEDLENEYIDFELDQPYEIASVRLWSNWCNGGSWGNAPKSWEVYGQKVQQNISDDLESSAKWTGIEGFTFADGKATPASSGESKMFAAYPRLKNYRTEAQFYITKGQFGVITYYNSENYCYKAIADKTANKVYLYKGKSLVAEKKWNIEYKTTLAITVNGDKISVWANEIKMMDYTDASPLVSGKFGLCAKDATGYFDSVKVSAVSIADRLPGDYPYEPAAPVVTKELTEGDFYVAVTGSDSNDGTSISAPFKTIAKAQQAVKAAKAQNPNKDYTVILRGGTYYIDSTINMTAEDGGTGDYRVTYAAYKGEVPVISGGVKVTSTWTPYPSMNGVYVTQLPEEFKNIDIRQMFVEDARATRSREPDKGETGTGITSDGNWLISSVDSEYSWVTPNGQIPAEWVSLNNTGVEYHGNGNWTYNRQYVDTFDTENNRFSVTGNRFGARNGVYTNVTAGDWLYFENALMFVDTEGEWYYDKATNKLYYYAENGVDPNCCDITVANVTDLLNVTGTASQPVKNLDFVGISFRHSNWYMPDYGRVTVQAGEYFVYEDDNDRGEVSNVEITAGAVNLKYAEGINIQDCEFTMLGEGGVNMGAGANSNRVENCIFTDVGAHGIFIGDVAKLHITADSTDVPRGNVIRKNYLNNCGVTEKSSVAIIATYANHTLIESNTVTNMPYTGISVGWCWDSSLYNTHHNQVLYNFVTKVMQELHDGAGIYFLGSQYNSSICNNYLKEINDGKPNTTGLDIYFDQGSRFINCSGNYMCDNGFYFHMCSYDELLAKYVGKNYRNREPAEPEIYGRPLAESGDVNEDGNVDLLDFIRLKKYFASKYTRIDKFAADLREDGIINAIDFGVLKNILLGIETEEPIVTDSVAFGSAGYIDVKAQGLTDYLTTDTLVSSPSYVAADIANRICDDNYSATYDSGSVPALPDEFVFEFDSALTEKTILQLTANYAYNQGPANIEIHVKKGTDEWQCLEIRKIVWDTTCDGGQSVNIPLDTVGVTALKLVVTEANLTWGHYIISEADLYVDEFMATHTLVFADEFNGKEIDDTKWLAQYFPHSTTDTEAAKTTYRIKDGKLHLYIDEDTKNFSPSTTMKVSSIQTLEKNALHPNTANVREVTPYESFACKYGYFEMRAKLPSCGGGGHAAWWLVGAQDDSDGTTQSVQNAEIDILETPFATPNLFSPKVHKWNDDSLTEYVKSIKLDCDLSEDYHVYAMDWNEDGITFYLDGSEIAHSDESPNYRMAMFLGVYTDSDFTGAANDVYPKDFVIDYVRVYQEKSAD